MALGQEMDPNIPLQPLLTSRDGTMNKDSAMWNMLSEPEMDGKASQKRPGLFKTNTFTGAGQGMLKLNEVVYTIQNDTITELNNPLNTHAIPGVITPGLQYSVLSDTPEGTTFIKTLEGAWIFNGTTVTKITDPNYPTLTAHGVVYLDGTYYVQDGTGTIFGSALEDPTTWPALNFIGADPSLGIATGILRHLNYVVSFYVSGMLLYYSGNNNPPASPLLPVGNAQFQQGCIAQYSAIEMSDLTFYMSKSQQKGRTVMMMEGLTPRTISTPYVEKILQQSDLSNNVYASGIKTSGHTLYLLTLANQGLTLAYDISTQEWSIWTSLDDSGNEVAFRGRNYFGTDTRDYFQDNLATGNIYDMQMGVYQDNLQNIPCRVRTANLDWKNLKRKFFAAMFLIADTQPSSLLVRYTDDDYQTYSSFRTIDLSTQKKQLIRLGSSRRRAWEFYHAANTDLRLYGFQLEMTTGAL